MKPEGTATTSSISPPANDGMSGARRQEPSDPATHATAPVGPSPTAATVLPETATAAIAVVPYRSLKAGAAIRPQSFGTNGRGVGEGVAVGATVGAVLLLPVVEAVTSIAKDDGVGGPLGLGSGLQAASGPRVR